MCSDLDLGEELLRRWMAAPEVAAAGAPRTPPWGGAPAPLSTVTVHTVRQHRHDGEDAFYLVRNLFVDPTAGVRVRRDRTGGPDLSIPRRTFRIACRPTAAWPRLPAPLTLASIKRALRFGRLPAAPVDPVRTLFVARDGAHNVFHALADVMNAWATLRMIACERIVFLDDHEDGPLMPLWRLLSERAVVRLRDLGGPCILDTAVFSPPGGCSFLWKNHWQAHAECRRESPLLRDFRAFVLARLPMPPVAAARVTLVRRTTTRRIANEGALVAGLRSLGVPVEVVDFAALDYPAQMRCMAGTRVLVGATGAGLTNLLWLPAGAGVVELVPVPTYAPAVFGNLAAWRGVRYAAWQATAVAPRAARLGPEVAEVDVDVGAVASLVAGLLR